MRAEVTPPNVEHTGFNHNTEKNERDSNVQNLTPDSQDPNKVIDRVFSEKPNFGMAIKTEYRHMLLDNVSVFADSIFFDEDIALEEEKARINEILQYLESKPLDQDLRKINDLVPSQYKNATRESVPPIFIHEADVASGFGFAYDQENGYVFVEKSKGVTSIQVILGIKESNIRNFIIHEVVHNLEPEGDNNNLSIFSEGIARLVEYKITNPTGNIHQTFISAYKEHVEGQSGHPLSFGSHNEQFALRLERLVVPRVPYNSLIRRNQNFQCAECLRDYELMASLIEWYRTNIDNDLKF